MNKPYLLIKILLCLMLFLNSVLKIDAQSKQLAKHIEEKLIDIDELITDKDYNLALSKLEDLESYKDFMTSNENRLGINLKRAQANYGNNDEEIAMGLLLNGLDELGSLDLPKTKTEYEEYLGEIFSNSRDYKMSLEYYRKSLISSYETNDTVNILTSYFNIGKAHAGIGNIDSAVYYYKIIEGYPQTQKTEGIIANSFNNLSAKAIDIDDLVMAEKYANKYLEIRKEQNNSLEIARALVNLSGIDFINGKFLKAENSYLEAYKLINSLKNENALELKSTILYNLAYSNEMLNKFESAYKYLEKATDLTDSLEQANLAKNISEVNAKYNVAKEAQKTEEEKSRRQRAQYLFYGSIFLFATLLVLAYIFYRNYRLKRENELDKIVNETQIKIINATIDAKENERKSIAETLHDSVSALLSSANLHLQATKAQLKTGYPQEITKAQTIVNEASVKIRDLSHELISSVLLKFGLAFAVHDMCQKYSNSEISLFSDDDGIKRYEQSFEIKIHNIIEELVNNILKHSKAKNASIILAHRDNNMLSIRMNDDGIGFDPKIAITKGGLGLSHIEARIKVMKGVFNIVSSKDNGTSIFILVPIINREV